MKVKLPCRTRAFAFALALGIASAAATAAPCSPSSTALCLSGGRFQVEVNWKDFQGGTGAGQAVPITADTGYFWFFSNSNIELIVKVLDARGLNGKFWVFFGALSNVEYDLKVTDSVTGTAKSYHNPSGQFASVGDTAAFDPAAAAGVETVEVQGEPLAQGQWVQIPAPVEASATESAEFTPCSGPATSLYLSNCRFHLDVRWSDSSGRTGSGQAVQLTNDTGYFWFFSETNVELVVKVLDARSVNGNFWVFFGALSNVEYTLHVSDTVSGALRTYHNPPSAFASVGDAAAFRGGYGISVATDSALAASGTITAADGGSFSATAADGSVFTLDVPPNAIFSDQEVTMTPVSAVEHFPFAGGLAAGVDLQPSGLVLLNGATLSIHTPAPMTPAEETPVAWNGSGGDFFLYPPAAAGGDLQMHISHFGGYGVARATDAERAIQLGREPIAEDDLLSHRISPLLRSRRGAVAGAGGLTLPATTDSRSDLKSTYDQWYGELRDAMVATDGEPDVVVGLVLRTLAWKSRVEYDLGPLDTEFPFRRDEIWSLFERIVKRALFKIHGWCSADPNSIRELPAIVSLADSLGLNVQLDVDATLQCLTFKLEFQSQISESYNVYNQVITEAVFAEVTLRTARHPSGVHLTSGEGSIYPRLMSFTNPGRYCTVAYSSTDSTFEALIRWTNLTRAREPLRIDLLYNHGQPLADIAVTCNAPGTPTSTEHPYDSWWQDRYDTFFHLGDYLGNDAYDYVATGWTLTGARNPWATKTYAKVRPEIDANELTTLRLVHAPE